MDSEEARFAQAWLRLLRMRRYHEYLLVRAVLEARDPPEFVKRVENHSWWAHDDFLRRHREDALGFREWLFNRLIPAVIAAWDAFDADGYFSPQYLEVIRRIAGKRLQGEDPEVLIDELWTQATHYLPSYSRVRGDFKRWINTIAIRLAIHRWKKAANRHAAATPLVGEFEVPDPAKGPSEIIEDRDYADVLLARIHRWDEMAAEIFQLRKVEGLSFSQIDCRCRHDPKLPETFRAFFERVPWEPTADEAMRVARLKRLFNAILDRAKKAERGRS
jgi:DNA-directed RNA polymerase specialized sigma24 family protein